MKIKLYRDGIGFSFWHHFLKGYGTAIRWRRLKPGLFGVRIPSMGGELNYEAIQLGCWWTVEIELICVHANQFEEKNVAPTKNPNL